jgi:hypothetical protein
LNQLLAKVGWLATDNRVHAVAYQGQFDEITLQGIGFNNKN